MTDVIVPQPEWKDSAVRKFKALHNWKSSVPSSDWAMKIVIQLAAESKKQDYGPPNAVAILNDDNDELVSTAVSSIHKSALGNPCFVAVALAQRHFDNWDLRDLNLKLVCFTQPNPATMKSLPMVRFKEVIYAIGLEDLLDLGCTTQGLDPTRRYATVNDQLVESAKQVFLGKC